MQSIMRMRALPTMMKMNSLTFQRPMAMFSTDAQANVEKIQKQINSHPVIVYSKSTCPFCTQAKDALEKGLD